MNAETFIIEVEKGLDWEAGYLDWQGRVVTDIKEAAEYDNEDAAEEEAYFFNEKYGRGVKIYARVR